MQSRRLITYIQTRLFLQTVRLFVCGIVVISKIYALILTKLCELVNFRGSLYYSLSGTLIVCSVFYINLFVFYSSLLHLTAHNGVLASKT